MPAVPCDLVWSEFDSTIYCGTQHHNYHYNTIVTVSDQSEFWSSMNNLDHHFTPASRFEFNKHILFYLHTNANYITPTEQLLQQFKVSHAHSQMHN
jgi:hypothetical protein